MKLTATETASIIIAVGGVSSNSGKTTLVCELLRAFPGWEAIKMTRGHYRSCGKSAHACCVSHLLKEEPVIRSGRAETDAPGKDTGRYWAAGASNVHWAIVTDSQVEAGVRLALSRVRSPGVFIEGTSFVNYLDVDLMLMCVRAGAIKPKPSARRVMSKAGALYLFDEGEAEEAVRAEFARRLESPEQGPLVSAIPLYTRSQLPLLIERIRSVISLKESRAGLAGESAPSLSTV